MLLAQLINRKTDLCIMLMMIIFSKVSTKSKKGCHGYNAEMAKYHYNVLLMQQRKEWKQLRVVIKKVDK